MSKLNKIIEREYFKVINNNPNISSTEVAKILDVSVRSVYRYKKILGIIQTPQKEINAVEYLKSKGYTVFK
jgi:hypothetical protein